MQNTNSNTDPQKKYWWLILIVLPILLALIALTPDFLNKDQPEETIFTPPQKVESLDQTTNQGHNFSNVQGNISITESNGDNEKTP